jgi:predicted Zn-dependent protease
LGRNRRARIRSRFEALAGDYRSESFPLRLRFRSGGSIGANALAIPNGTILITDELVELAADSIAVMGVLAHEMGHLHLLHGMQIAIQASSLPILVALVTGDLASGSSLLGTIPLTLVSNGYSRAHEREADAFALELLERRGLRTEPVAELFEKMLSRGADVPGWLSTHPATAERIDFFRRGGTPFAGGRAAGD